MRQSKAHEDAATVREAAGEAIGIPANGVTREMAATGSDSDATSRKTAYKRHKDKAWEEQPPF